MSLSVDEDNGDHKLPAARPAVLSTAAISSLSYGDDDDNNDHNHDDHDNGGLNEINGMSEYELKRMRNVARNNARLASLGLLGRTPSTATLPL